MHNIYKVLENFKLEETVYHTRGMLIYWDFFIYLSSPDQKILNKNIIKDVYSNKLYT